MTYAPHATRWVTSTLIYLLILAVAGVVYYSLYIAGQEEHLGKRALRSLSYVGAGISRSLKTLKTSADTATATLSKSLLSQIETYRDMGGEQEAERQLQELAKQVDNQAKLNPRYRHLKTEVRTNCDLAGTLEKTGDGWKFAICGDRGLADKGLAVRFQVWLEDLLDEMDTDALEDFDQVVVVSPNGEILHVADARGAEGHLWPPPPNTRDEFLMLVSVKSPKSERGDPTNAVSNQAGKPEDQGARQRSENRDRPGGADGTEWVRRLFGETEPAGGRILSSRAKELDLGGRRFTVFLQPHPLPLRYRLGEEPAEFESVYIIGLVASERWMREKLMVAPTTLGLLSTAVAVVILSFPLFKLWTKGAQQHTARSEAYALAVATFVGVGFIAILFVDGGLQWRKVQEFDGRLRRLSGHVSSEFGAEFQDKLGYMAKVAFAEDASTSDRAGEGISDHTSERESTWESGDCRWAAKQDLSADGWSNNDPPPMTEIVFFADHKGNQSEKRLYWRDTNCDWKPSVSDREYFRRARDGRVPVVDRVFALDTGRPTGVMAMPLISVSVGDPVMIAVIGDFAALRWRLLPPGFEYAVIKNDTGEVVYHTREHRSLIENLIEETNNDMELVAALKGGRPGFLDLDYHHWEYRGYIAPLGQDTGWSLLVMYDKQLRQIPGFEALVLAVGQFVAFAVAVMVSLVLFALMARWRRRPEASWRWLNRDHLVLAGWLCVIAVLPGALSSWSAWSLQDRTWNEFTRATNDRNTKAWETAFGEHMRHVYQWDRSKPEFEPILSYLRRDESMDGESVPEARGAWGSPAAVLARSLPAYSHLSSYWHLSYLDSGLSILSELLSSGPAVVVGTVLVLGLLPWLLVAGVVPKLTVAERRAFQPTRYLPASDTKVILVGVFEEGMKLLGSRLAFRQEPLVVDAAPGTSDHEVAGEAPVIVYRFEEALADPAAHPKTLNLLERLRDRPGPVIVASAVDPYYWLTSRHAFTRQTAAAVSFGEVSPRWYRTLGGFQVLRARDVDRLETDCNVPAPLERELRGLPDLASRAGAIKAQCYPSDDGLDHETIGRCVLKQARGLYQNIWSYSSDDEKLALHHLANGALVNPRDRDTLHSLFTRGLIDAAAVFEITTPSFRSFVQAAERPERWVEIEKAQDPGMWGSLRGPLTLVIVLALAFLAYVYKEQYSVMLALLGSIPALLPALERLFGLLGVPAARAETKGV